MIEHPLPRSDEAIKLMAKKQIAAVPTLQVYNNLFERQGGYYGSTSRRFSMNSQSNFDVFKKMKAAGIVLGVGTDSIGEASNYAPNMYIAELKWFVKGGFTIQEALKAATLINARLLDMDDLLGSVEAGKLADIIVVDGRPYENLDDLARIDIVVKDGLLLVQSGTLITPRHETLPLFNPSLPEDVN
jgi:imidazolonepropionase-like amidohydrolase